MRDFRDLQVWQKAHRLTLDVYRVTKDFPSDERFGLIAQLRRSAASVPANVAERWSTPEFWSVGRTGASSVDHVADTTNGTEKW